eukprot:3900656-Alexandrium_andersonii.AAC.1
MSASLVGSEMCIRDSSDGSRPDRRGLSSSTGSGASHGGCRALRARTEPVSYTHLTLPTICSV